MLLSVECVCGRGVGNGVQLCSNPFKHQAALKCKSLCLFCSISSFQLPHFPPLPIPHPLMIMCGFINRNNVISIRVSNSDRAWSGTLIQSRLYIHIRNECSKDSVCFTTMIHVWCFHIILRTSLYVCGFRSSCRCIWCVLCGVKRICPKAIRGGWPE